MVSSLAREDQLYIGWAMADITPPGPVALTGNLSKRISEGVHDPLNATVLAIETRAGDNRTEQAIMVSCDLLFIRAQTQKKLQRIIAKRLPDFDASKIIP
jgi:hypothetical protein